MNACDVCGAFGPGLRLEIVWSYDPGSGHETAEPRGCSRCKQGIASVPTRGAAFGDRRVVAEYNVDATESTPPYVHVLLSCDHAIRKDNYYSGAGPYYSGAGPFLLGTLQHCKRCARGLQPAPHWGRGVQ